MKVVIFAGGVGTRLWPLSRKNTPKQFEKIVADKSMLQLAVSKLQPEFPWKDIYISSGSIFTSLIKKQLPDIPDENIIQEPAMRDIGPAVGLAMSRFVRTSPDEPIALLWGSDHLVKKEDVFKNALNKAETLVRQDPSKIVFIGQKPRFASQNLGYIEFGEEIEKVYDTAIYAFKSITYSPDLAKAREFVKDQRHCWNLGYFVTTPRFLWSLFERFTPQLFDKLAKISEVVGTKDYEEVLANIYPTLEKVSFDQAILQKMDSGDGKVLSVDIGWSDIGAWEALKEALSDSEDENVTKGNVMLEESKDALVFNYTDQLCVGIDLNQMLVINTKDVVLVCPKNSVSKIKKFVEGLAETTYEHLA